MRQIIKIDDTYYEVRPFTEDEYPLVIVGSNVAYRCTRWIAQETPPQSTYRNRILDHVEYVSWEIRFTIDYDAYPMWSDRPEGNWCSIAATKAFKEYYFKIIGQWKIRRLKPCKPA